MQTLRTATSCLTKLSSLCKNLYFDLYFERRGRAHPLRRRGALKGGLRGSLREGFKGAPLEAPLEALEAPP